MSDSVKELSMNNDYFEPTNHNDVMPVSFTLYYIWYEIQEVWINEEMESSHVN